jgi:cyclohexanone monooxygenase
MTFGPYTGGFNWFSMLESQLRYIVRCIVKANKKGATYVEISQKAHDKDFQATLKKSKYTIFQSPYCSSANSYYFDAKGDPSLPSVISPLRRWIITKFAGHRGFLFK